MKEREYRFDIIRLISTLLVVVIHFSNQYCRYLPQIKSVSFIAASCFNAIGRISVPLFFMISGALTLNRDISPQKLKNKIIHFLSILVSWTLIYIIFDIYFMKYEFTKEQYLTLIYDNLKPHLWFMYVIIALYIISPFARILAVHMSKNQKKYFLALWIIFCGGSSLLRIVFDWFEIKTTLSYEIPLVQGTYYLGYFLAGSILYEAVKNGLKLNKCVLTLVFILSDAVTIGGTLLYSFRNDSFYSQFLAYRCLPVMLASLSLYLLIISVREIKIGFFTRFLSFTSPLLFGVYLIHIIYFDIIVRTLPVLNIPSCYGIPLFSVITFTVSLLSIWILSEIPLIKKIVK
ncbi:MAG: acyltransferase family protein [Clostridia bacterium]|nr:acyltransferase family protein [Clostridia bacterium]